MVGRSISGTQKDVDTKSDSDRCVAMAADGLQLSTFRVSKDEPGRRWERHTISMRPPITLVKTFQIPETSCAASGSGKCASNLVVICISTHQTHARRCDHRLRLRRKYGGHLYRARQSETPGDFRT